MSIWFKRNSREWCRKDGRIGVDGVEYHLSNLDFEDLKILDSKLKEDLMLLEEMVRRKDLEMEVAVPDWREQVRFRIGVRKRQAQAIIREFTRRKKELRSLDEFFLSAVYQLYGGEGVSLVRERAKEIQERVNEERTVKIEVVGLDTVVYGDRLDKKKMCGIKIKHIEPETGVRQIDEMAARGLDTEGLGVYGPCPFCGFYHVGHRPKESG